MGTKFSLKLSGFHKRIFKDKKPYFKFKLLESMDGENYEVFVAVDSKKRPFFGGHFKF
jgi:hypothetical protein